MAIPSSTFNSADSIFAGLSVVQFTPTVPAQITGVTAATDTITKTAHGYSVGMLVTFVSGTGFTGLSAAASYYVISVPTADTFKVSATVTGSAISVGTSSAGVFELSPLVFESKLLSLAGGMEEKELELPDAQGILRVVRTVTTKENEEFGFEVVEPKRMLAIFGGKLSGSVRGTCILYVPDPDDASGKCSLKSESFSCRITRDGGLDFGNSDFTKAKIKVKSYKLGAITWTRDVTV